MYYCIFCGRQLEDGQLCDCEESRKKREEPRAAAPTADTVSGGKEETAEPLQSEPAPESYNSSSKEGPVYHQEPEKPKKPSPVGIAFKNFFPFIKALLQKPENAVESIAKHEDAALAAIYMALFSIGFGLFFFGGIQKTYDLIGGKVNFFLAFFYGFLLAVILLAVTLLTIFIIGKALHSEASFKKVFAVTAVPFVYPAFCILLGCLSLFLPFAVTVILIVLAIVSWIMLFALSVKTLFHTNENDRFFLVKILVLTAVLLLSGYIVSKYTAWSAVHTFHEKSIYFEDFNKYIK